MRTTTPLWSKELQWYEDTLLAKCQRLTETDLSPVITVNPKQRKRIFDFLYDQVFYAKQYPNIFFHSASREDKSYYRIHRPTYALIVQKATNAFGLWQKSGKMWILPHSSWEEVQESGKPGLGDLGYEVKRVEATPYNFVLYDDGSILISSMGRVVHEPSEKLLAEAKEALFGEKPQKVIEKVAWEMTRDEYAIEKTVADLKDNPELKQFEPTIYREHAARHSQIVKIALAMGKYTIPQKVLADYPELVKELRPTKPKVRPLPPDAQNVQELPFDAELFTCYGKQTKRGFRAYCRRKK